MRLCPESCLAKDYPEACSGCHFEGLKEVEPYIVKDKWGKDVRVVAELKVGDTEWVRGEDGIYTNLLAILSERIG